MSSYEYDAIVVGSGPNGLSAAITLQQQGLSVLVIEGKREIGGGTRTAPLTLEGFQHDICSAVHPMGILSPFFKTLPLHDYGLEWLHPRVAAAHPLDNGSAGTLFASLEETIDHLGRDAKRYRLFMEPTVDSMPSLLPELLSPFPTPSNFLDLALFGIKALPPASWINQLFTTPQLKGLWSGMAAHSIQPLDNWITSAIGIMLMAAAHVKGWPIPKGGSHVITKALASHFIKQGGTIQTDFFVQSIHQLPRAKAVLFDVTPRQLVQIAGDKFTTLYKNRLDNYRYGMGVFKVDWALSEPAPFINEHCRQAGTVHVGGTAEEVMYSEKQASLGHIPTNPFVLYSQPTILDPSRAPENKHVGWGYCHVPHGSNVNMTDAIERQIERFAPGFRDTILARHTYTANEMEAYNPNYIGGDINGGVQDIFQHFSRPILSTSPYRTSQKGIYLCSSSTPPGGGVHGMCGYHAARRALRDDIF